MSTLILVKDFYRAKDLVSSRTNSASTAEITQKMHLAQLPSELKKFLSRTKFIALLRKSAASVRAFLLAMEANASNTFFDNIKYYPLGTPSFHSFAAGDQAQYLCILRLHDFIRPLIDKHKHKVDLHLNSLTSRYFSATNSVKEFLRETMSNGSLPDDVRELFVPVTFSGSRALGDLLSDSYNILFLLLASPLLVLDGTLPICDYLATRIPGRITFKHFLEISRVTTEYSEFSLLMRKVFESWKSPIAAPTPPAAAPAAPAAAPAAPDGADGVSRSSLYPRPTLDPISAIDDFASIAPADPFPHIRPVDVLKEKELPQRKVDGLTISKNVSKYKPLRNSFDSAVIISSVSYAKKNRMRTPLSHIYTGLRVGGTCIVVCDPTLLAFFLDSLRQKGFVTDNGVTYIVKSDSDHWGSAGVIAVVRAKLVEEITYGVNQRVLLRKSYTSPSLAKELLETPGDAFSATVPEGTYAGVCLADSTYSFIEKSTFLTFLHLYGRLKPKIYVYPIEENVIQDIRELYCDTSIFVSGVLKDEQSRSVIRNIIDGETSIRMERDEEEVESYQDSERGQEREEESDAGEYKARESEEEEEEEEERTDEGAINKDVYEDTVREGEKRKRGPLPVTVSSTPSSSSFHKDTDDNIHTLPIALRKTKRRKVRNSKQKELEALRQGQLHLIRSHRDGEKRHGNE